MDKSGAVTAPLKSVNPLTILHLDNFSIQTHFIDYINRDYKDKVQKLDK